MIGWDELLRGAGYGVGVAVGFAMAVAALVLKGVMVDPLVEAVYEWWEGRLPRTEFEQRLAQPQVEFRSETIVISDLHVDTWDRAPVIAGRRRWYHFRDFLRAVRPRAIELHVNGDIADMPMHPAERWHVPGDGDLLQSLLPKYARVFMRLAAFNGRGEPPIAMYMAGNHDLAASGVRYLLHHRYEVLRRAPLPFRSVWYGHFIVDVPYVADAGAVQPAGRYFIEHGHYHDPVLALYLVHYLAGAVSSNLEAALDSVTVAGQRRLSPRAPIPPPGVNVREAADVPGRRPSATYRFVMLRWRWRARRALAARNAREVRRGAPPLSGIVMGHTHMPDFWVYRLGRVRGKVYVNTGDWSGLTGHATYAVISQDGLVYLHDWHWKRSAHHRVPTAGRRAAAGPTGGPPVPSAGVGTG